MTKWVKRFRFAVCLLCTITLLSAMWPANTWAAEPVAPPRATLPGHVLDALSRAAAIQTKDGGAAGQLETITLTVVLRRSDPFGFQQYLRDVYDTQSPQYRKFLAPTEVSDRFGPSQRDYAAVQAYFEQQGFTLIHDSANRMTLTVRGTRGQAETALAVKLNDYQLGQKRFYANDRDPSLPASLSPLVQSISGLSTLATPHAATKEQFDIACGALGLGGAGAPLIIESLATFALFGYVVFFGTALCFLISFAPHPPPPPVKPAKHHHDPHQHPQKRHRRGKAEATDAVLTPEPSPTGEPDGTGQKIGLLEFDSFQPSDVSDYLTLMGVPTTLMSQLSKIDINGGTTPGADASEVLLDIEMVMLGAPGATYVVYDAPSSTSYEAMFNAMINDGVTVISNSWSSCEDEISLAEAQSIDAVLQTAAASGISVFNAAGDSGTTCIDGSPNTVGVPADSPNATSVGGTSLAFGRGGLYGGETLWTDNTTPPSGQGGFGLSKMFPRPNYQNGLNVSAMRSVPDVSINADPASGAQICEAADGGCPNGKLYGGTSMSAPMWAAFAALINDSQGVNLGNFNLALYPLANTAAFHDAASMGSDFAHVGLGSPNLDRIDLALAGETAGPVDPTVSQVFSATTILNGREAPVILEGIPADGVSAGTVIVRLMDTNGDIVSGKTVTLAASAGSHAVITPSSGVTSVSNGAVAFTVIDLTPETVTFNATDTTDNVALQETDSLTFGVPPAASAGIMATPTTVASDGSSTTTITVTLQDSLGRPTPAKLITLSQGSGHSITSGPNPSVTDVNGQIQFTATDNVPELVTYTAVDVTDGDESIPGSAGVTFTGGSTSCVTSPPTAATGFSLTAFATGFPAQNFIYSSVHWGGCPGASNPAFDTSGNVFVSDSYTGNLSKFGLTGGAVSSANTLAMIGQALQQGAFGKDGSLYVARGATGSGFSSGTVLKVDPNTGAVLQTLATGLTCPSPLAVDPLSGDLFFTDTCFGAGSDNPSLWRIQNTASASPNLVVYATLPSTPNGPVVFAPNGTMYVGNNYNGAGNIIQVAGTNAPSPPAMTTLSGINSDFWITMGEVLPNGAAKSLLVHNDNALELVDITTSPFTTTVLANGSLGTGTIGPDGCLYAEASDTIFKLAPTSGGCSFVPSNPSSSLVLSPSTVSPNPAQGTSQSFTATFKNTTVPAGTPVLFTINGVNAQAKLGTTDATGAATVSYTGRFAGNDKVVATSSVGNSNFASNPALLTWGSGAHATFLTLNLSPSGGIAGQTVTVAASLADLSVDPTAPVAGVTIAISIGNQTCNGVTDAQGTASCTLTIPQGTALTLTASFSGNSQDSAATASEAFLLASSPPAPSPTHAARPIPTLDGWARLLVAALVLLIGLAVLRRRDYGR